MIVRCAPYTMRDFIAASSVQSEQVQKVLCASRNVLTARLPLARRACNADRNVATKNAGRYLHDLTRRRVIETSAMGLPNLQPSKICYSRQISPYGDAHHERPGTPKYSPASLATS
jgi:hypothetical protein